MLQSRKKPPEVGMYDACGGAASLVMARIVWIQPKLPLATASCAAR